MNRKTFKSCAPFGVATKRFNKLGFHPELDKSGAMKREITKVGPGSYNPHYPKCDKKGSSWDRKAELEEFSKYLGFRNAHVLNQRRYFKTLGGPGSNDVNFDIFKAKNNSVLENVSFGTQKRCKTFKDDHLAPGTYNRHIFEKTFVQRRQFTNVPSFEWDGFIDRLKDTNPLYWKAPNRYNPKFPGTLEETLNKVVSLRGPFDLFTGPRDNSTIKNHFAPKSTKIPEYGYIEPSDLDVLLKSPTKKRYGLFLKATRFPTKPVVRHMLNDISLCYRNPNDPGPAQYDLSRFASIQTKSESIYPFDSSNVNARPPIRWKIHPGPGRYNPKYTKCLKMRRASWVFASKTARKIFPPVEYSAFLPVVK